MTRGKSFTLDQDVAVCNARLSVSQDLLNVLQANILFLKLEKKRFAFNHCWEILQHNIKWKGLTPSKRSDIDAMVTDLNVDFSPKRSDPPIVATNLNITSSLTRSGTRTVDIDPNVDSSAKRSDPPTIAANLNTNSSPKRCDPFPMATNPNNVSPFSSQSKESDTLVSYDTDKDSYYTAEFLERKRSRRRAEKEACKRSKVEETLDSHLCDVMEKLTKQLAETDDRKAKIAERKVKVMEEASEREQREHDDRIMSTDTTNMEPRARAYYEQRQNDVYFKTMAHSKDSSNMDLHTIAH
ncbi:unnamed protein product [Malus baccata var. baccata]